MVNKIQSTMKSTEVKKKYFKLVPTQIERL